MNQYDFSGALNRHLNIDLILIPLCSNLYRKPEKRLFCKQAHEWSIYPINDFIGNHAVSIIAFKIE